MVARAFEEGEDDGSNEGKESASSAFTFRLEAPKGLNLNAKRCFIESEHIFLIGGELDFRVSLTRGKAALLWTDLTGGIGAVFEFVAAGASKEAIDQFVQCMCRALYERKYRRSFANASPEDLLEFVAGYVSIIIVFFFILLLLTVTRSR